MTIRLYRLVSELTCVSFALLGCQTANEITWFSQSASADHAWLALAHTEHTNHGFGGESQWTSVELKQNIPAGKPVEVLSFEEGQESAAGLTMTWPSTHHLDIKYRGDEDINFQAVKAFGIDVTVEKLP